MNKGKTSIELVTIAVVNQLHEAYMLKALLEEEGIVAFLQNEMLSQIYSNIVGGIQIQVPGIDAERARNFLVEGGYIS